MVSTSLYAIRFTRTQCEQLLIRNTGTPGKPDRYLGGSNTKFLP